MTHPETAGTSRGGAPMKLNEALRAVAAARGAPVAREGFLACGFEPLHLPVYLQAHHLSRFPGQGLRVGVGLYGDLLGNLERARQSEAAVAWVVIEWSDLDPRLGCRSTGPWSGDREADVLATVEARLGALRGAIERLSQRMLVVIATPSLPFPLLGHTPGWQASGIELALERELASWCCAVALGQRVRVLHPGRLLLRSPIATRGDVRGELATGFPYGLEHASTLAEACLALAFPSPPKKGLITDLDDTLWSGLVGEVGADAVSWSQAESAQLHGLYQSLLRQLSDAGVLLGIASKNEEAVARAALARGDLLLGAEAFFPVAVGWGPKSDAVSAILRTWNIGADAVVVVDDSRMELEEIRRSHPGITCLEFAPKDPRRTLDLLVQLRDLFGKPSVQAEDKLRLASIRSSASFEQQLGEGDLEGFLSSLEGALTFDDRKRAGASRVFELLNKTNQFNLNGRRLEEADWLRLTSADDAVVVSVGYADRYGALGTIGAVAGRWEEPRVLRVEHWVLSCRAFSRRIEDHMLRFLFATLDCDEVRLMYRTTERNKPLQDFLGRLGIRPAAEGPVRVARDELERAIGRLPHREVRAENTPPA